VVVAERNIQHKLQSKNVGYEMLMYEKRVCCQTVTSDFINAFNYNMVDP